MKEIPLTQGKVALVDDELYPQLSLLHWCALRVGPNRWYAVTSLPNSNANQYMHRRIVPDAGSEFVHHVNGNPLDNRRENLVAISSREHSRLHNLGKCKPHIPGSDGRRMRPQREVLAQEKREQRAYSRAAKRAHRELMEARFVAAMTLHRAACILMARKTTPDVFGMATEYCNLCEAAKLLGLSRQRVHQIALRRRIGTRKDGHWRFNAGDLATIRILKGALPIYTQRLTNFQPN